MSQIELKRIPLIEALVEVRWELESPVPNLRVDPHFKLLLGRLYDRVRAEYPAHEQLPTASIPDEMAGYIIQHRFRSAPGEWPLVQIGPGILSANETTDYTWEKFRNRAIAAVNWLFEAHPVPEELKIDSLLLRYIDARQFDFKREDTFAFLREMMQVSIELPATLFANNSIDSLPQNLTMQTSFACVDPPATITLGFATGQANEQSSLVWETLVQSTRAQVPTMPTEFEEWLDSAHEVAHDWFFKLVEGDLLEEFQR